MPSLVFLAGPIAGRRYKLGDGEYVIGRRSDCQIFVPDMRVSRQHARLWRQGEDWALEDLGSNNGTFVNGVRLQQATHAQARRRDHDREQPHPRRGATSPATPTRPPRAASGHDRRRRRQLADPVARGLGRHPADRSARGLISVDRSAGGAPDRAQARCAHADPARDRGVGHAPRRCSRSSSTRCSSCSRRPRTSACSSRTSAPASSACSASATARARRRALEQRDRGPRPGPGSGRRPFGGELRVPGTIIQHVVSDRRGVLLGETTDEDDEGVGTRMGAPLIYHGAHYGVVYVESKQQAFRQEDVDLLQAIATQAGIAIHATRVAAQLVAPREARARPARRAADPALAAAGERAAGRRPRLRGPLRARVSDRRRLLRLHLARPVAPRARGRRRRRQGDQRGALHGAADVRAAVARRDRAHAGAAAPPRQPGDRRSSATTACSRRSSTASTISRIAQPRVHERRPLRAAPAPRRPRVPAAGRARAHAAARRHARPRGRRGARAAALRRHADHGHRTASSRRATRAATSTACRGCRAASAPRAARPRTS